MVQKTVMSTITPKSYRLYLRYWFGQNISIVGSAIVMFTIIWKMADLVGNNNTELSIVFFLNFLPQIIIYPIAGVIADKFNKKRIILISDSMQALLTLILILFLVYMDFRLWQFYIFNFLRTVCQVFHNSVSYTLIPIFVPKEKITRINGMNFLSQNLSNIVAGPIAVFLMLFFDFRTILWLDILTFCIALIPLLKLSFPTDLQEKASECENAPNMKNTENRSSMEHFPTKEPLSSKSQESLLAEYKSGFAIIKKVPGLLTLILMLMVTNFVFRPFETLKINFIKYSHGGTEIEYSFFTTAHQIGTFIGALFVSLKKTYKHWNRCLYIGMVSTACCWLMLSLIPSGEFIFLYLTVFFLHILNPLVNTLLMSVFQLNVSKENLGKAISIMIALCSLLQPFGCLISGPISDRLGFLSIVKLNITLDSIQALYLISALINITIISLILKTPKITHLLKRSEKLASNHLDTL
ncbi:MFS transporter [Candidatus Lokiarchaeum ossiferum]|uniref:MFS transporter n=1 Tax=Candidatus Lokiarchaeum ossiferum TaxID=2951803 RepID=UPI00352BD9D6